MIYEVLREHRRGDGCVPVRAKELINNEWAAAVTYTPDGTDEEMLAAAKPALFRLMNLWRQQPTGNARS